MPHDVPPARRADLRSASPRVDGPLLALVSIGLGCTPAGSESTAESTSAETSTLTVLAATSLSDALEAAGLAFSDAEPAIRVEVVAGSSSATATSIIEGAPGDVFVSADTTQMDRVESAGLTDSVAVQLATNRLEIMVASGNPLGVDDLSDLAAGREPDVLVATAVEGVPIRAYTDEVFDRAGIRPAYETFEANVGGIVTKVNTGAVDAGVVYRTDVIAAGDRVTGVPIPDSYNVVARTEVVVLAESKRIGIARSFVDFLRSADGRRILESFGFETVPASAP